MYNLYLPYLVNYDPDSGTYCCSGIDRRGELFGVGSGSTVAVAASRLREAVLESLLADAADGHDFTSDLLRAPRGETCLVLPPQEWLPVRIRMARHMRRLKQAEVAARMGISQQAYARLERLGSNPTIGMIARLEEALQQEVLTLV